MCQGNGEVILTHPFVLLFHFLTCYMLLYLGVLSRYSSSRWVIFHFYVSIVMRVNVFIVTNACASALWTWKLIKNPVSGKTEQNAFFVMNARKLAQQRCCTRENGCAVMEQGNVECERQVNSNLLNHSHRNMNIFGKKKDII